MPRIEWGRVTMRPDEDVDTTWMDRAACKGEPVDWFFMDERDREHRAEIARARMLCRGCAVRDACLTYAEEIPVDFGMWGGMTPKERERRRFAQRRPRPRKRRGRPL